jgi:hypothetical protein
MSKETPQPANQAAPEHTGRAAHEEEAEVTMRELFTARL